MKPDVVYVAWNRLDFTKRTFAYLVEHTDWDRVGRFIVYDDRSQPASRLWLQDACADVGNVEFRVRDERWGSPVAIMADYLSRDPAPWFVKLDNDIAVPPGWLEALCSVAERVPGIDLLGMEAGMTVLPYYREGSVSMIDWDGVYGFEPSTHIGGIGLMRTHAFARRPLVAHGRYWGFTEWQHLSGVGRGWIKPDLECPLLDRIPDEPFSSWSTEYVNRGWQRAWGPYGDTMKWAYEWVVEKEAECATA